MCSCDLWFRFSFSLLFSPSGCIPLRFLLSLPFLFCSPVAFCSAPFPPLSPLRPFRSSSLLFLLWLDSFPPSASVSLRIRSLHFWSPTPLLPFAYFPCSCFLLVRWVPSLAISDIFPCVGNPASGLSFRLCLPRLVVFSLASPASFSESQGGGGGGGGSDVCVLFPPSGVYALSGLCLAEFMLLIQSSGCFCLFLWCHVLASLHQKGFVGVRSYAPPVI